MTAEREAPATPQDHPHEDHPDENQDGIQKAALLEAALRHVPFDGFTEQVLDQAAKDANIDGVTLDRLFPNGPLDLVEEFSLETDRQMQARLATLDIAALRIRERISTAILSRIDVLRPHKEAARRAAAFLSLPPHAPLGAKLLWRTVDLVWRASGDTATDFNYYTKRGILSGVFSATMLRWFNDDGEDESATKLFLENRIDDVMRFEKFKAKLKQEFGKMPPVEEFFKRANPAREPEKSGDVKTDL